MNILPNRGSSCEWYDIDFYDICDCGLSSCIFYIDGMYIPQSKGHTNPYMQAPKKLTFISTYQKPKHIIKSPDSRSGVKGHKRLQREGRNRR